MKRAIVVIGIVVAALGAVCVRMDRGRSGRRGDAAMARAKNEDSAWESPRLDLPSRRKATTRTRLPARKR